MAAHILGFFLKHGKKKIKSKRKVILVSSHFRRELLFRNGHKDATMHRKA
jgi:hypothetical protein